MKILLFIELWASSAILTIIQETFNHIVDILLYELIS